MSNQKRLFILTPLVIILCAVIPIFTCTIFNAAKNGIVLAGNNEDMFSTDTKVWFMPASEGKFGVVYVGFENYGKQGAMNDQGLFFDGNALKFSKMKPQPAKLPFPKDRDVIMMIMEECATVEDVLALISRYNPEGWDNSQAHFADRTGGAAVIGADKNGEMFIAQKKGIYQVSTNFSLANPEFGAYSYPCPRYDIATDMLEKMEELTVDYCRSILAAVHSEGSSPTVYSNICDLTNGDIYLYNFHHFEEGVKFNLAEELKKGEHVYTMTDLFPRKTNAQIRFEEGLQKQLSTVLGKTIEKKGIQAALKEYRTSKDKYSEIPGQLSKLAFLLKIQGKTDQALKICELCVKEFPKLPEAHKALGDLYVQLGKKSEAKKSYEKFLKLDPANGEVIAIMKDLENN